MNRAFIEWGRRKIGLPEKPVINSGCIDATKERHCIIVFADEPMSINGWIANRCVAYFPDPYQLVRGDMLVFTRGA